jgi:hypothetical protein
LVWVIAHYLLGTHQAFLVDRILIPAGKNIDELGCENNSPQVALPVPPTRWQMSGTLLRRGWQSKLPKAKEAEMLFPAKALQTELLTLRMRERM